MSLDKNELVLLVSFFKNVSQIGRLVPADLIALTVTSSLKYCIKLPTASNSSRMVCLDEIRLTIPFLILACFA